MIGKKEAPISKKVQWSLVIREKLMPKKVAAETQNKLDEHIRERKLVWGVEKACTGLFNLIKDGALPGSARAIEEGLKQIIESNPNLLYGRRGMTERVGMISYFDPEFYEQVYSGGEKKLGGESNCYIVVPCILQSISYLTPQTDRKGAVEILKHPKNPKEGSLLVRIVQKGKVRASLPTD